MCRLFKLHCSGFYQCLKKPKSHRAIEDNRLLKLITTFYVASGGTYGSPWIHRFSHPYHSWERGLNETTNGFIRQYITNGVSMDVLTPFEVDSIMGSLNNRPIKCLGFRTTNQVLFGIDPPIALAS